MFDVTSISIKPILPSGGSHSDQKMLVLEPYLHPVWQHGNSRGRGHGDEEQTRMTRLIPHASHREQPTVVQAVDRFAVTRISGMIRAIASKQVPQDALHFPP